MPKTVGPEIDWIDNPQMPPKMRGYALESEGYEEWRFILRVPDLAESARITSKHMGVLAKWKQDEVGDRMEEYVLVMAPVGATLIDRWNFLDRDGNPIAVEDFKKNPAVLTSIPSPAGWEFVNAIGDFMNELQNAGRNQAAADKFRGQN